MLSLNNAEMTLDLVMKKTLFWKRFADKPITDREKNVLNIYLNGYEGKISSKNWASLAKCSSDTANRDLQDLRQKGILVYDDENTKRRTFHLAEM